MEHIDLRKLNISELKQVRGQVVRLKSMLLTIKEESEIRETIIGKTPHQLKMAGFCGF